MANCLYCGKELTGLQTKFCCRNHKSKHYNKIKSIKNKEEKESLINPSWKKIDDFYYVTPEGKIWSTSFRKFLKPCIENSGYEQVSLHGKQKQVHRLVAKAFIPNPKKLPQVNHIDGNKRNNNVSNLEWTDAKGNYYHAREHNLCNHGTFLNKEERKEARKMYKTGKYTYKELSKKFNISEVTLWRIFDGLDHPKKQKKISDKEGNLIAKTYHTGKYSREAVGRMFGVSGTTVGRWHEKKYGSVSL